MVGGALGRRSTRRPVRALLVLVLLVGCGASRVPQSLRRYDILVEPKDEQSIELARAMKDSGYRVRERVRGGSRPTAAVIHFVFSDPGPAGSTWLHVRLADTRSGVIVGAATVQLDSTTQTPRARASAAVQALSSPLAP